MPEGFSKIEVKQSLEFEKLMNSIGRKTKKRKGSKKSSNKSSSRGKLPKPNIETLQIEINTSP